VPTRYLLVLSALTAIVILVAAVVWFLRLG
jgi:hypothetical protein